MPVWKNWAGLSTDNRGYEFWRGSQIKDNHALVYVHRLLAVADLGVDAVSGNIVHHKNGIPWDNRPENIEVMDQGQHVAQHLRKITQIEYDEIRRLYATTDATQAELGERFGVDGSHISRIVNGEVPPPRDDKATREDGDE